MVNTRTTAKSETGNSPVLLEFLGGLGLRVSPEESDYEEMLGAKLLNKATCFPSTPVCVAPVLQVWLYTDAPSPLVRVCGPHSTVQRGRQSLNARVGVWWGMGGGRIRIMKMLSSVFYSFLYIGLLFL